MGISSLSATELVAKAQAVHDAVEGNPALPTPVPAMGPFKSAIDALATANAAVDQNPGTTEHRIRRVAEKNLRLLIKQLAGYVQNTSNGDANVILGSGFAIVRRGTPVGELKPPTNLGARLTNTTGRVSLRWEREDGADMHHVFMSSSNNPFNWVLIGATTKSRFNADSLEPGTFYWFAVTALGAAGESSKSDPLRALAA